MCFRRKHSREFCIDLSRLEETCKFSCVQINHSWSVIRQRMKLYTVYLFWLFHLQSSLSSSGADQFSALNVHETNPGFLWSFNCCVIWYHSAGKLGELFSWLNFHPSPILPGGVYTAKNKAGNVSGMHIFPSQKYHLWWVEPRHHTGGHDEG